VAEEKTAGLVQREGMILENITTWDKTILREEFLRSLPAAVGHVPYQTSGNQFQFEAAGRCWRITLEPLTDLRIGLLRLPRHRVSFSFSGYSDEEIAAFMARCELYFRRGGG